MDLAAFLRVSGSLSQLLRIFACEILVGTMVGYLYDRHICRRHGRRFHISAKLLPEHGIRALPQTALSPLPTHQMELPGGTRSPQAVLISDSYVYLNIILPC